MACMQVETGNPYMLYKDNCNRKSNQQNLARLKSSPPHVLRPLF